MHTARLNDQIKARIVRTVDENGKQVGLLPIEEARRLASAKSLDLVEVAAGADPPVCRIMDYGKYRYEQMRREKLAKKHQSATKTKEIKLHPLIDAHDLTTKTRHARDFLEHGHKVKVTMIFRGRQIDHIEYGQKVLGDFRKAVEDVGGVESEPRRVHKIITMIFGPRKGRPKTAAGKEREKHAEG